MMHKLQTKPFQKMKQSSKEKGKNASWKHASLHPVSRPQISPSNKCECAEKRAGPFTDAPSQTHTLTDVCKPVIIIHWVVWPSFSTRCLSKPFSWFPVKSNEIIPERHVQQQNRGSEWGHRWWRLPRTMRINTRHNLNCLLQIEWQTCSGSVSLQLHHLFRVCVWFFFSKSVVL